MEVKVLFLWTRAVGGATVTVTTIICFLGEALEAQRTGTQEGEEQAKPTGWRGGKGLVVVRCGPPAAVDAGLRCECG